MIESHQRSMKVTAKLSAELYAGCPNCGNDRAFCLHERIRKDGWFSGWSCDTCHHVYSGQLVGDDWELALEGVNQPTLVLLALPPQKKPVYFVVDASVYAKHGNSLGSLEREDDNRYLYEESTCPTNVVSCQAILNQSVDCQDGPYVGDDHGIFKYVGEIPRSVLDGRDSVDYMKGFSHLVPDLRAAAEELGAFDDEPLAR